MAKTCIVIDTETTSLEGFVYDLGYTVATSTGEILMARTWLVEEIFTNGSEMMGAFYAKKFFSFYAKALESGAITLKPWREIANQLALDFLHYNVNIVAAYNIAFDKKVIRNTQAKLGDKGSILPPCKQLCIMKWAQKTRLNTKSYRKWCKENGFITPTGRAKTTAEVAYRYFFGNWDFVETHTALDDALMETELLAALFKSKKKIPYL